MSTPTSPGLYGSKGGDTTPPANPDPVPLPPDTSGDDVLQADAGSGTLYGGKGQDTAVFEGQLSDYLVSFDAATWQVVVTDRTGRDGAHHLSSIEALRFGDTTIALDGFNGLMRPADDAGAAWQTIDGYPPPAPDAGDYIVYVGVTTPGNLDMGDNVAFDMPATAHVVAAEWAGVTVHAEAFGWAPPEALVELVELVGLSGMDGFAKPLLIAE